MLRNLDFSNLKASLLQILMSLVIVLISLTFHEVAHGWMADKLGDHTAKERGRLSLNPFAHLDPIGFFLYASVRLWMGETGADRRAQFQAS